MTAKDKHFSFVSYEKINGKNTCPAYYAMCLKVFVYECMNVYYWAQLARVFHYTWLEWHAREKHSRLWGPFESYKENK
jgi:hypothetical protein